MKAMPVTWKSVALLATVMIALAILPGGHVHAGVSENPDGSVTLTGPGTFTVGKDSVIDDKLAKDIPVEKDVMTVVYVDAKKAVMVDDTYGIETKGDFKEALVLFAYNPQIPQDIDGASAESGLMSINCVTKQYKLLSDNILDNEGKVFKQNDVSKKEYTSIPDGTLVNNIYSWVCKGVQMRPPTKETTQL